MPRYFFALDSDVRDLDGDELPDDAAAVDMAKAIARELGRNNGRGSQHRVIVRSENGDIIHEEPLSD